VTGYAVDEDGNSYAVTSVSDYGYLAPPGERVLRLEAPGCAPDEQRVHVSASHAKHVDGRLAIADDWLQGPAGAPDGFGLAMGGFSMSVPGSVARGTSTFVNHATPYAIDGARISGLVLSTSFERRFLALALDTMWGYGSFSGSVSPAGASGPLSMTGNLLRWSARLRIGARLPLGRVSLAGGSGLGGGMWVVNRATVDESTYGGFTETPQGVHGSWSLPLWASATFKPACDWGVQVIGSYDLEPTHTDQSALFLGAALLWQPSAACAEPERVRVTP
jgi:hypothetical protein